MPLIDHAKANCLASYWVNRYFLALTIFVFEFHYAVHKSEQAEITSQGYVLSRVKYSSYLAHEDATRVNSLTAVGFYTTHFGVTIASVFSTTTSFF